MTGKGTRRAENRLVGVEKDGIQGQEKGRIDKVVERI
jgi:hypothetical protein